MWWLHGGGWISSFAHPHSHSHSPTLTLTLTLSQSVSQSVVLLQDFFRIWIGSQRKVRKRKEMIKENLIGIPLGRKNNLKNEEIMMTG